MCGRRARWVVTSPEGQGAHVVEVVCSEPDGHPPDQHYDGTYSSYFPDSAGQPRARGRRIQDKLPGSEVFTPAL